MGPLFTTFNIDGALFIIATAISHHLFDIAAGHVQAVAIVPGIVHQRAHFIFYWVHARSRNFHTHPPIPFLIARASMIVTLVHIWYGKSCTKEPSSNTENKKSAARLFPAAEKFNNFNIL
jgi:hypothetical protein